MPSDRHPDADQRLAALGITPTPADVLRVAGPTVTIPAPTTTRKKPGMELHEIRSLFVKKCYDLLTEPKVWNRVREHLVKGGPKESLQALDILVSGLVTATKTEETSRAPVSVQILNHIPGPRDVTP